MEIDGEEYKEQFDAEFCAKLDRILDLTERLMDWLSEQGIDYSHIAREYVEEQKRLNG